MKLTEVLTTHPPRCPRCLGFLAPRVLPYPERPSALLTNLEIVVQKLMRHANIKLTVDLYGHLDLSDMRDAMESMPDAARKQVENLAAMPFVFRHVAVMPDVHGGIGATVGSVIATERAIIPAAVGVVH